MAPEHTPSQAELFEKAKRSIAAELDGEMLRWDFSTMVEELKGAISRVPNKKNPTRFFTCYHLHLKSGRAKEVRQWVVGQVFMSADSICVVLRALRALRGNKTDVLAPTPHRDVALEARRAVNNPHRKIVDHTITVLNSLRGLIETLGVQPEVVFDSDRMQIDEATRKIRKCFSLTDFKPTPRKKER